MEEGNFDAHDVDFNSLASELGGRVEWIKGFYNETLVQSLPGSKGMKPAALIDIDSDLYISAYEALDFMFSAGLVRIGTVIGYDDFWFNFWF